MAQYNTTAGALLAVNDARCQGLIAQIKRIHRASNWGRASLFSESETFDRAATDWRNKRGNHGAGVGQRSNSSLSLALRLSLSICHRRRNRWAPKRTLLSSADGRLVKICDPLAAASE